jgi:hypothetical protein
MAASESIVSEMRLGAGPNIPAWLAAAATYAALLYRTGDWNRAAAAAAAAATAAAAAALAVESQTPCTSVVASAAVTVSVVGPAGEHPGRLESRRPAPPTPHLCATGRPATPPPGPSMVACTVVGHRAAMLEYAVIAVMRVSNSFPG